MLERLGELIHRRARTVLIAAVVLLVAAGALGLGAFGKLKSNGFDDPASDSSRAATVIKDSFGGRPDLIIDVHARTGTVDDQAANAAGRRLTAALAAHPGYRNVTSYFTTAAPALRSGDGRSALILVHTGETKIAELPADVRAATASDTSNSGPIGVRLGGDTGVNGDINAQVGKSLGLAEGIAVPVTLVLLVLAFGSVVAALVPLTIGFVAILGTFAELFVIGSLTNVSIFAINLTTALGLGLAIDYALLIVARHREMLHSGADLRTAVVTTVRTAGRTILFSAATVAAALSVLLVFPEYFLRSMAYAGIGVVVIAALSALIIAPAMLTVLGPRVESLRIRGIKGVQGAEAPFWSGLAGTVMRRPAVTALPVLAVLLLAASPLLGVSFGTPDDRVLPTDTASRQVGNELRTNYPVDQASTVDVVVRGTGADTPDVTAYAHTLSTLPGVSRVDAAAASFASGSAVTPTSVTPRTAPDAQLISVSTDLTPKSGPAQNLIHDIRALPAPGHTSVLVGGDDATLVDTKASIADRLPLAFGLIVVSTFVILFLFTGSVVQPIRALFLNGLSIAAAVGVTVWVFQGGHLLSHALGFTPLPMDTSMTVLLFCIAFALSMDYEVFVTSRITELHRTGMSTTDAVRHGLGRTGRIVTTAAALLAVTFVAFLTGTVSFLQLFGFGAALAILIDSTLVRGILVPATMRILGSAAWWAPAPLRRLHRRIGLSESDAPAPATPDHEPAGV